MDFEKNYQAINLSKQMNIHRTYLTQAVSSIPEGREYHINPKFITGFVDGSYKKQVIKRLVSTKQSCTNNHLSLVAQQSTSLVV